MFLHYPVPRMSPREMGRRDGTRRVTMFPFFVYIEWNIWWKEMFKVINILTLEK